MKESLYHHVLIKLGTIRRRTLFSIRNLALGFVDEELGDSLLKQKLGELKFIDELIKVYEDNAQVLIQDEETETPQQQGTAAYKERKDQGSGQKDRPEVWY